MIPAIPTTYKGRLYRSRLEARWAAFFDALGWKAEYEPYDLNGWISDFLIIGKSEEVLCEVKPFSRLEEYDIKKMEFAVGKIQKDILLLGVSIWPETENETASIGWLGECWHGEGYFGWASALFTTLGGLGFAHAGWSYYNRITGEEDGHIQPPNAEEWEEIMRKWNNAANVVQWFPNERIS